MTSEFAVSAKSLVVRAPSGDFQLGPLDLLVPTGAIVAVIGHNGAGKSTLLDAVLGLHGTDTGRIELLGRPLGDWSRRPYLRRRLGVQILRTGYSHYIRVREIVHLHRTLYGTADEEIGRKLAIPALISKRYGVLSQGERRRVHIYLALAHHPDLVFLDEPSSGLDEQFRAVLLHFLAVCAPRTVIMATHDPAEARASSHLLWIEHGRVRLFAPTPNVLSADSGDLRNIFERRRPAGLVERV